MGSASQEFDRELFTLKLSELTREMQIKSVASDRRAGTGVVGSLLMNIVNGQLALLRYEWLMSVDRIAREVWQTQRETITPTFVRDVLLREAMTLIEARESTVKASVAGAAQRTHLEDPHDALQHLAMEIRKLQGEVGNRYEIEARELEYNRLSGAQRGSQRQLSELGSIRGLISDATKDTVLWLQADPSTEERVHVFTVQERLLGLARIIERRMEQRSSPNDVRQWHQIVAEVLALLDKAREVRGHIVGKGLARLADHLPKELPATKPRKRARVGIPPPIRPLNTSWAARPWDTREAEYPAKPEASKERANQSALPPGLCGVGDPVDGNPFPPENPRYAHWQQATLKAEEELCLLNVQFMKNSITREPFTEWMQRGGPFSAERELAVWTINFVAAKFDIWAKRMCHVVWDEYDLKAFDKWLFDYAESWLRAERDAGRDSILPELRDRLIEHMEYWKAAARGTLTELRRVGAENSGKTGQAVESKPTGRPRKDAERKLVRALKANGESWKDIAAKVNAQTRQNRSPEAYRSLLKSESRGGKNGQK